MTTVKGEQSLVSEDGNDEKWLFVTADNLTKARRGRFTLLVDGTLDEALSAISFQDEGDLEPNPQEVAVVQVTSGPTGHRTAVQKSIL